MTEEVIYVGIGARKTPEPVLRKMRQAATFLAREGCILRSGGAKGADSAFEDGCDAVGGKKEIFLPWKGFNGNPSKHYGTTREARILASRFHPNWEVIGPAGRDFHGRNCYQILGQDLETPAKFVLCWTDQGRIEGGTGQALRMALHYEIPIFNFGNQTDDDISELLIAACR